MPSWVRISAPADRNRRKSPIMTSTPKPPDGKIQSTPRPETDKKKKPEKSRSISKSSRHFGNLKNIDAILYISKIQVFRRFLCKLYLTNVNVCSSLLGYRHFCLVSARLSFERHYTLQLFSEQFQSSFRAISEQFQSNFRAVSEQFQSSFRAVSDQLLYPVLSN